MSTPSHETVEFREPKAPKWTPEQIEARLRRFTRIGRRCAGNQGRCAANAATFRLVAQEIDEGGNDVGEPVTVQCCARHRRLWTRSYKYRVLSIEHLPPQTLDMIPPKHRDSYVREHPDAALA